MLLLSLNPFMALKNKLKHLFTTIFTFLVNTDFQRNLIVFVSIVQMSVMNVFIPLPLFVGRETLETISSREFQI